MKNEDLTKLDNAPVNKVVEMEEQKPSISLFGNCSPKYAIKMAKEIAVECADLISKMQLFTMIHGKLYVHCEGWTTVGALLGVFAHVIEVEDLSVPEHTIKRYRADVQVKNLEGQILSQAQSECSNEEKSKGSWEDYALRSMAETRAISKALRIPLGWIMKLANYEPLPFEEVTDEMINPNKQLNEGNGSKDIGQIQDEMDEAVIQKIKSYLLEKDDPKETVRHHMKRQIQWLQDVKLNMGASEFKEKVCDIPLEVYRETKDTELIRQIRNMLLIYATGAPLIKIEWEKKDETKKADNK